MRKVTLVADPYPPYQFEENGTLHGIDYEVISEAFRIHDIDIETRLCTWEECIGQMEDHKVDGIFQITRTPDRENRFLFTEMLRMAKTVFFKREEDSTELDRDIDVLHQLHGLKVGVLSGYIYNADIDRLAEEYKLKVGQSEQLVKGLVRGEFDLALLDEGVAFYLIRKLKIKGIIEMSGYEIKRMLYVAFQKDMINLVNFFNSGLQRIRQDGLYIKIMKKYGLLSAD
ncbi:MAG: amino acid ABC transporter substrate-binding protein [Spirochaetota bacterium]|nr:MAG: amino acid ABC transporter substrate-binding protein [Spirochaetota bacterium]